MSLTAEQIKTNWESYLGYVDKYISSPRKELVKSMLTSLEEVAVLAPASSKESYHNAFPGGLIDHALRVVDTSINLAKMWKNMGGTLDFTGEELVFSCLFYSLGKLGDGDQPHYIPQTNDWRRTNFGELYTNNPNLHYMTTQDRTLYILQKFGVPVSQNEYLAIRLYDGVFNEANKAYYNQYNESNSLRANIVFIINTADHLSAKLAQDISKNSKK